MTRRRTSTTRKHAVRQRESDYEVGHGKPPKEHCFKPGESGNPDGPPRHRTNLWLWFTKYMGMTNAELTKLDRTTLTAAQQTALRLVQNAKAGRGCRAERLARYVVDREEGKAVEHLVIDKDTDLTDEECDQLRELLRQNHGADADE